MDNYNSHTKADGFALSGLVLKMTAFITMFIDHAGRGIVYHLVRYRGAYMSEAAVDRLRTLYTLMRAVGRMAFPLFCFLLVEGCIHTRSIKKYMGRLLLFAIIAEIPFDLMLYLRFPDHSYQNVLWTLLLGAAMIAFTERFISPLGERGLRVELVFCLKCAVAFVFGYISYLAKTDYSYKGIALIFVLYIFHSYRGFREIAGFCVFYSLTQKIWFIPSFIMMYFYSPVRKAEGERGVLGRIFDSRFSYVLYPAHMLLFYLIVKGVIL